MLRKNPLNNIWVNQNEFDSSDELVLSEIGFKLAFGVMNYMDRSNVDDPDHVEWKVYLETRSNLEIIDKVYLSFHKCSSEEFA